MSKSVSVSMRVCEEIGRKGQMEIGNREIYGKMEKGGERTSACDKVGLLGCCS